MAAGLLLALVFVPAVVVLVVALDVSLVVALVVVVIAPLVAVSRSVTEGAHLPESTRWWSPWMLLMFVCWTWRPIAGHVFVVPVVAVAAASVREPAQPS